VVVVVQWVVLARKALLPTITMLLRTQVVRVGGGRGERNGTRAASATADDGKGAEDTSGPVEWCSW